MLNYLNSHGRTSAPPQLLLHRLLKMFPGALPSQILQEDWRVMQELLTVDNAIEDFRDLRRRLLGGK